MSVLALEAIMWKRSHLTWRQWKSLILLCPCGRTALFCSCWGNLSAVWHCLCVCDPSVQHCKSCSVVLLFPCLFQGDDFSALDFHLQKIILTSQNITEECADRRLKNYCSSPSLVGRFLCVLLASKTRFFFYRSKIYDSSGLFKFAAAVWSSSNPKYSDLKQNTGICLFSSISSMEVWKLFVWGFFNNVLLL